jgi:hypothetical protein
MDVTIEVIKKYAPAIFFHENERVHPCSIEHLLEGSTLKWRTWSVPNFVRDHDKGNQRTGVPAVAVFKGNVWMVYSDSDNSQLWVTTSSDNGDSWDKARHIEGQSTSVPALAAFQDKLWMVYTGSTNSQVSPSPVFWRLY